MFYLMDSAEMEIAIVDCQTLYGDIDLRQRKTLKQIFTYGTHDKHTVVANCPIMSLEDGIDFDAATTDFDHQRVFNFEPTANKQQVLTYGRTSGSTGYG